MQQCQNELGVSFPDWLPSNGSKKKNYKKEVY